MSPRCLTAVLAFVLALVASARGADFLSDNYWDDGRAEFLIYEGTQGRYGVPQPAEVQHIFVREHLNFNFVKADDWRRPGNILVLKLNQVLRVQTGLYVYQQMHSGFWRVENGEYLKWSLTSSDSCGNSWKIGLRASAKAWNVRFETYWDGMEKGDDRVTMPVNGWFYDELPLRVRALDFSAASATLKVPLAPTTIGSKNGSYVFLEATVTHRRESGRIVVEVAHARGKDVFQVDEKFPHLIREWRAWDGGVLTLKHALKVKYWELNQPGAREKAIADPANRIGSVW